MIQINKQPGQRVLELGGGFRRNPASDCNVDIREGAGVDFTVDFHAENWPIKSSEWDAVLAVFVLEHISWRNSNSFLKEVHRILKPGGRAVFVIPNTEAQLRYILAKPEPDGDEGSMVFGTLDYPENSHRSFWSPRWATRLFQEAGFSNILIQPYGEPLKTDMVVEATKPSTGNGVAPPPPLPGAHADKFTVLAEVKRGEVKETIQEAPKPIPVGWDPAKVFDRQYFDGGKLGGGFAGGGYADFPAHEVTARHILARNPQSVLELGAARGYVLKRVQDMGVPGAGLEVSEHCHLTRVCTGITTWDLSKSGWPVGENKTFDLCYSVAVLEHLPEGVIPQVIQEMARVSQRGLHGVGFHQGDDRTKLTVRPQDWWQEMFRRFAPGYPVEVLDKDELEKGEFPKAVLEGDGLSKWNLGSYVTMFHHGWMNMDLHDLHQYANAYSYKYLRHDLRSGIPTNTGVVDLIFAHHVLEHLAPKEGLSLLRECRRVLRPGGALRVVVPNARVLSEKFLNKELQEFDQCNQGSAEAPTQAGKLKALLYENHQACYDPETLDLALREAGFTPHSASFRKGVKATEQIRRETLEMDYGGLSLFYDAVPDLGG